MNSDRVITAETPKELLRKILSDPVRKAKRDRKNENHRRNERRRSVIRLSKLARKAFDGDLQWFPDVQIDGITLQMTCPACPEQYDAFIGDEQVGYLRLRHGEFRVECPDYMGEQVYAVEPEGDGRFTDTERDKYLTEAVDAILKWRNR